MNVDKKNTSFKNIHNQENVENFYCKVCEKQKSKDNFYLYTKRIENKIIKSQYLTYVCKDCLPIEAIYIGHHDKIKVNQKILLLVFKNNQLLKLKEKYGLILKDLISRSDMFRNLGLNLKNSKDWVIQKENIGLIHPIIIYTSPGNFGEDKTKKFYIYYLKQEFETLKSLINKGFFYERNKKSIKRGAVLEKNKENIFIGKNNKQYIFVDTKEHKKPCVICLNTKDFVEFHENVKSKDGRARICKECACNEANKRYQLLDKKEKLRRSEQTKQWIRDNKEKVRLYRKIKSRTIEERIKKNLRKRIQFAIGDIKNQQWADFLKTVPYSQKHINEFGCSTKDLIIYLESKFLPNMTWKNYGAGNGKWNIDHIKCVSSFNLNDTEEIKKINYYTNLLPMWDEDNNTKRDKTELCPLLDKEFLDKYKELEILIKKDKNDNIADQNLL